MTSPVFRYAVLVVLLVVVVMGAGVCYRTRSYQRRGRTIGMDPTFVTPSAVARDWGPKPDLFDVYLRAPKEKPESEWEEMMPISVTRGALDASGASSLARVSIIIKMPLEPHVAPEPLPDDDEQELPYLEIGLSNVGVLLTNANALRSSSESDGKKKGS